jgi:spore maturation protein CgeB
MRIVLVGETNRGSRTPQRMRALRELGHDVVMVPTIPDGWSYETKPSLTHRILYRLRLPPDPAGANRRLVEAARAGCDVMVLDNARIIHRSALVAARKAAPGLRLVWYSEDDTLNPVHRTRWLESAMPLFDLWVTTKSFNAHPDEVPALGARQVSFVDNSFCPHAHAPIAVSDDERRAFGAPVSFVGTYEPPRAADLLALARAGISVRVWGNGWDGLQGVDDRLCIMCRPVYDDDYRRVVAGSDINLCFLRKGNRDLQTCRSMEIPAMGGFMIHEASIEMTRLFTPDREAVYFSSTAGLVDAVSRWLADPVGRAQIAAHAHDRARADNHSHHDRWRSILALALDSSCAS